MTTELTQAEVGPRLSELAANCPQRRPVIAEDDLQRYEANGTLRQWNRLGAVMLRETQHGRLDARKLTPLLNEPVAESLPSQALHVAALNRTVARMLHRYPQLTEYADLPVLPDNHIGASLQNPIQLTQPADIVNEVHWGLFPEAIIEEAARLLAKHTTAGSFNHGITQSERDLAAHRYRLGRDMKLVALGAELMQQSGLQFDERNKLVLPSGTTVTAMPGQEGEALALLAANQWHGRSQIGNRVYRVTTATGAFILKERRTNRHLCDIDQPDLPAADSHREITIANTLAQHGTVHEGDITVGWERPIGSVQDPSGFQFAVFEDEGDLTPLKATEVKEYLSETIIKNPGPYQTEFRTVQAAVNGISFEKFARIKARMLHDHANLLLRRALLEAGYASPAQVDHAYRVEPSESGLRLQIIGFDFEHFTQLDPGELTKRRAQFNDSVESWSRMALVPKATRQVIEAVAKHALSIGKPIVPAKFELD